MSMLMLTFVMKKKEEIRLNIFKIARYTRLAKRIRDNPIG